MALKGFRTKGGKMPRASQGSVSGTNSSTRMIMPRNTKNTSGNRLVSGRTGMGGTGNRGK